MTDSAVPPLLRIGSKVTVLPVIHGSAQFACLVGRWMLDYSFQCVALPLPGSFREPVEAGVLELPRPAIVIQPAAPALDVSSGWEPQPWQPASWPPPAEDLDEDDPHLHDSHLADRDAPTLSYVPIDPCQSVIAAIRAAMGEHIPREYIDLETDPFRPYATVMPDPFAVRQVAPERFAAAVLPSIHRPPDPQTQARIVHMAARLIELEQRYERILFVVSLLHWPWIREAYHQLSRAELSAASHNESAARLVLPEHDVTAAPVRYGVAPRTLMFLFGELPFITSLYERARSELEDDRDLQIDGVKELLISARQRYRAEYGQRARRVTSLHLSKCLQYIRNLSLIHRRMTPDLITIVTAAQQILGDQYALQVVELANRYAVGNRPANVAELPEVSLGIDQARLPDGELVALVNRLPGPPVAWRTIHLKRRPTQLEKASWSYRWNPYSQCSYPPEDVKIEHFRSRVVERAQAILGQDLARTEKFTTSIKDGIDVRDTLRHWYERQIYVKDIPPARGTLDACVMLFDSPADPRDYPWRTTWFAENEAESTLAFFATDYRRELVGPGIGLANYGGAMFLYPPRAIPNIWTDRRLDFAETLEERLLAAACLYSRSRQIALLSPLPPGGGWRRLARRYKKQWIQVPLNSFGSEQIGQLRMVHVLNGKQVRSYAADFIRKA